MFDALLTLGGGLLLYLGAEWLVKGSAGLARHLGVPPLLVGLTVVAYGTSAPEAIVTIQGSLGGFGALAAGNIVGSNIANLGLILGLALVLRPAPHEPALVRREVPVLLGSSALLVAVLADGALARWEGLALFLGALGYSVWMVRSAQAERAATVPDRSAEEGAERAGAPPGTRVTRLAILLAVGLVMVMTGGHLLVKGSVGLARALGLSERIIGLTLVAVGTSLPELATSALAALRGHSALAVGNVVGSNIFNVLLCLGLAGTAAPFGLPEGAPWTDLIAMGALTLLATVAFLRPRPLGRALGWTFLGGYVIFLAWTFGLR